jgi:enamine deaminase RidA (YjgF/YER057c/UK114 family)
LAWGSLLTLVGARRGGFIGGLLAMAGMTMDDHDIYRSYFTRGFPARAFIGSGPLLFGMRFEMQAIAIKR